MNLNDITIDPIPGATKKNGEEVITITDKSLKIETSPGGEEILNEEFVGSWKVSIRVTAIKL